MPSIVPSLEELLNPSPQGNLGRSQNSIVPSLDELIGTQVQPQNVGRTVKGTAGDVANTALKGFMAVPEAVVGLGNLVSGGRAGKFVKDIGVDFEAARKASDDLLMSDAQRAAQSKVDQAEGFVDTVKAYWDNPSTIVTAAGEALPSMLGGQAIAKGLMAVAPKLSGILAGAIGEGTVSAGSTAESIRQQTSDGLLTGGQSALAAGSGALTSLLGVAGGKFAKRIGIDDIDNFLLLPPGQKKPIISSVLKGMVSEGVIEEMPQSIQEQIAQNLALDKPWDENVGKAAASGAIVGAAMGGGMPIASRLMRKEDQPMADLPPGRPADTTQQPAQDLSYVPALLADVNNSLTEVDGSPDIKAQQLSTQSKLALSLSQMDPEERMQAVTFLAQGDQAKAAKLEQLSQDESMINAVDFGTDDDATPQLEFIDFNNKIRNAIKAPQQQTQQNGDLGGLAPDLASQGIPTAAGLGSQSQIPGQPASATPSFLPEPISQVQAQLDASAQGRKPAVVIAPEQIDKLDLRGMQAALITDPNTGEQQYLVAPNAQTVQTAVNRAEQVGLRVALGEALGAVNPTLTSAPQQGTAVLQQFDDATGQILNEEAVTPESAGQAARIPGTTPRMVSPQQALAERQQAAMAEQQAAQQEPVWTDEQQQLSPVLPQQPAEPKKRFFGLFKRSDGKKKTEFGKISPNTVKPGDQSKQLAGYINAQLGVSENDPLAIDPTSIPEIQGNRQLTNVAKGFKKAFGTDVVFVSMPDGVKRKNGEVFNKFGGLAIQGKNKIYINVAADGFNASQLLGHELVHILEKEHADIYKSLERAVFSRLTTEGAQGLHAALKEAVQKERGNTNGLGKEFRSEIVAEGVGEMAQDPAFWEDVFRKAGADSKSMYDKLMDFLRKASQAFIRSGYVEGAKDIQAVRRAATDAFVNWSARNEKVNQEVVAKKKAEVAKAQAEKRAKNALPSIEYTDEEKAAMEAEKSAPKETAVAASRFYPPRYDADGFPRTLTKDDPLLKETMSISSDERRKLRLEIIESHFAGKQPETYGKPELFLMGGGGGAGKSTSLARLRSQGLAPDDSNFVSVNADDIKESLPEFNQIIKAGDYRAALTVHEESSLITKAVQFRAMGFTADEVADELKPYVPTTSKGKYNLLIDGTMSDAKKGIKLVETAQDRGYYVSMMAVVTAPVKAIEQAKKRGEKKGRYVPNQVLYGAHSGFLSAAEAYSEVVNNFTLVDNSGPEAEIVGTPQTLRQKIQGWAQEAKDAGQRKSTSKGEPVFWDEDANSGEPGQLEEAARERERVRAEDARVDSGVLREEGRSGGREEADQGLAGSPNQEPSRGREAGQGETQDPVGRSGLALFSRSVIERAAKGDKSLGGLEVLQSAPDYMTRLGVDRRLPVAIDAGIIHKIATGKGYGIKEPVREPLTVDQIERFPELLKNPAAVFDDPTQQNSVTVMTSMVNKHGDPIVIAISKESDEMLRITRVTGATNIQAKFSPIKTAFGKNWDQFGSWLRNDGPLRYIDPAQIDVAVKAGMPKILARKLREAQLLSRGSVHVRGGAASLGLIAYAPQPSGVASGSDQKSLRQTPPTQTITKTAGEVNAVTGRKVLGLKKPPTVLGSRQMVEPKPISSLEDLRTAAEEMSDWKTWYDTYEEYLGTIFGGDTQLFKKILSATSQAASVKANVGLAIKAYRQMLSGVPFEGYLGGVVNNLNRIKTDQQLSGMKIGEFGKANDGDDDGVAIDRHVSEVIFGTKSPSPAMINMAQNMIRTVAADMGWKPKEVQAALWAWNITRKGGKPESYDVQIAKPINQKRIRQLREQFGDGFGSLAARGEAAFAEDGRDGEDVQRPDPVRAGGVLFRRTDVANRNSKTLEKARSITLMDLVGRKVFPIFADLTAAGEIYMGQELLGGPYFTLLPQFSSKGIVWANDGASVTGRKANLFKEGATVGIVVAMTDSAHASNASLSHIIFSKIEEAVASGQISASDARALDEFIVEYAYVSDGNGGKKLKTSLNKSTGEYEPTAAAGLSTFPGLENKEAAFKWLRAATFDTRSEFFNQLGLVRSQERGVPSFEKILRESMEESLAGLNKGDAILAIEFDATSPAIKLGEESGTPIHPSYQYGLKGRVIGKFDRPISFKKIWRDWYNERREAKAKESTDYRSLQLRMSPQLIDADIAGSVGQTAYKDIQTPAQAKVGTAVVRGEWVEAPKTGKGVATLVREAADSDLGLTGKTYTEKEAKAMLRKGDLRVFSIPGTRQTENDDNSRIWMTMERQGEEWVVTSMINNEPGTGSMIDGMLAMAAEVGADRIAVTDPSGNNRIIPVAKKIGFNTKNGSLVWGNAKRDGIASILSKTGDKSLPALTAADEAINLPKPDRENLGLRFSRNFERWFGNSTIVNKDGTPRVMYHGTARDITSFKAKQANAIFVTDDPGFAEDFANSSNSWMKENYTAVLDADQIKEAKAEAIKKIKADYGNTKAAKELIAEINDTAVLTSKNGEAFDYFFGVIGDKMPTGPNILPLYVKAEKPFDFENRAQVEAVVDRAIANEGFDQSDREPFIEGVMKGSWDVIEEGYMQKAIRDLGHDSFYVKEGERKNLAVYEPTQIKSATGNNGEYSLDNPDIRYSRTSKETPEFKAWLKSSVQRPDISELGITEPMIRAYAKYRAATDGFDRYGYMGATTAEKRNHTRQMNVAVDVVKIGTEGTEDPLYRKRWSKLGFLVDDAPTIFIEDDVETRYSRNATKLTSVQDILDFAQNGKLNYNLGDAIDRGMWATAVQQAKDKTQRDSMWTKLGDGLISLTADSMIAAKRWIQSLPIQSKLVQRLDGDLYRASAMRSAMQKDIVSKYGQPLFDAIEEIATKYKMSTDEAKKSVGTWMTAKYAPKANDWLITKDRVELANAQRSGNVKKIAEAQKNLQGRLADVNGAFGITRTGPGVAGGMNKAEAAAIRKALEQRIDPQLLAKAAQPMYDMLAEKRAMDLGSGKVNQTTVNSWPNHADYVPLTGDPRFNPDNDDIFANLGGNAVNQDSDKELNGRKDSVADDAIDAAYGAMMKSINFRAFQDFKRSLNEVYLEAQKRGQDIGLTREAWTGVIRTGDDVIIYRDTHQGNTGTQFTKAYTFRFKDARVMGAIKKSNHDEAGRILELISKPTRLYARAVTQFSAAFAPVNFIRDIWERSELIRVKKILDAQGNPVNTDSVARSAIANSANPQLWKASIGLNFDKSWSSAERADLEEMIRLGGSSTWGDYLAKTAADLEKEMRSHVGMFAKGGRKIMYGIEGYNNSFEMIAPLAIYRALKAHGVEAKDAAAATLDMMNFKKQGSAMPFVRALYVFAQPAAQSGYNLAQYLNTTKGKIRFTAQMAVGVMLYSLLKGMWGDDDDEGNKLDNLSNYTVERSIPIPIGDSVLKVPVGFGPPQLAWSMAATLNRLSSGRYTTTDALMEAGKAWVKSVAPVAPSDIEFADRPLQALFNTFIPTIARPIVNVATDQTAFGQPLTPSFKDDTKARSEQFRRTTPEFYADVAKDIRETFGIDLYPDHIKAITEGYMVGPLREAVKVYITNPAKEVRGEPVSLPVVAQIYDRVNDRSITESIYYRVRKDMEDATREFNTRQADGTLADWATPEKMQMVAAYKQFEAAEKAVGKMRSGVNKMRPYVDLEGRTPQIQAIEGMADQMRKNLIRQYAASVRE